jgi:hypothetical protein
MSNNMYPTKYPLFASQRPPRRRRVSRYVIQAWLSAAVRERDALPRSKPAGLADPAQLRWLQLPIIELLDCSPNQAEGPHPREHA